MMKRMLNSHFFAIDTRTSLFYVSEGIRDIPHSKELGQLGFVSLTKLESVDLVNSGLVGQIFVNIDMGIKNIVIDTNWPFCIDRTDCKFLYRYWSQIFSKK